MYHFEFVGKKERAPVKRELISIIRETQNLLRADFTFRFDFVGSDKHNTVTCDLKSNIGYDFDVKLTTMIAIILRKKFELKLYGL